MQFTPLVPLLALGFGLLAGCSSPSEEPKAAAATPSPIVQESREVLATIEAVDPAARTVTLLGPDGQRLAMLAGPEVGDLDQIQVGDQVVVRYREALAAQLKEPGAPAKVGEMTTSATESPAGSKPETEVARQITTTVTIENVDPAGPTVSFTGPNGVLRMIQVKDPEMQTFARTLKPGDEVDITYSEALALSVEPAP